MAKKRKTQFEHMQAIRGEMPLPSRRHMDRKKKANKEACRGRVQKAKHQQEQDDEKH